MSGENKDSKVVEVSDGLFSILNKGGYLFYLLISFSIIKSIAIYDGKSLEEFVNQHLTFIQSAKWIVASLSLAFLLLADFVSRSKFLYLNNTTDKVEVKEVKNKLNDNLFSALKLIAVISFIFFIPELPSKIISFSLILLLSILLRTIMHVLFYSYKIFVNKIDETEERLNILLIFFGTIISLIALFR